VVCREKREREKTTWSLGVLLFLVPLAAWMERWNEWERSETHIKYTSPLIWGYLGI